MSVFFYEGHITELTSPSKLKDDRGWLKSTAEHRRTFRADSPNGKDDGLDISIEAWDNTMQARILLRITADEAFQFALGILRDVSLAKYGAG